jgi:hypothetical protein
MYFNIQKSKFLGSLLITQKLRMKKINLYTESYLFDGENGEIRAIPFFELSIDEWVIYQNQEPKYLLNFNYRESSFVKQISESIEQDINLEEVIHKYGIYLALHFLLVKQNVAKAIH